MHLWVQEDGSLGLERLVLAGAPSIHSTPRLLLALLAGRHRRVTWKISGHFYASTLVSLCTWGCQCRKVHVHLGRYQENLECFLRRCWGLSGPCASLQLSLFFIVFGDFNVWPGSLSVNETMVSCVCGSLGVLFCILPHAWAIRAWDALCLYKRVRGSLWALDTLLDTMKVCKFVSVPLGK